MGWSFKNLLKGTPARTNSLHRISLVDQVPGLDRGTVSSPGVPLSKISQAGSLSSCSNSSASPAGSACSSGGPQLEANVAARNQLRRRSMPAMHLHDSSNKGSVLASVSMMTNPPVFDNPLRRRGCCNHQHTEQMQHYRREAIQRELRVKRAAVSVDDIKL